MNAMQKSPSSCQTKPVTILLVAVICFIILSCISSLGIPIAAIQRSSQITIEPDWRGVVVSSLVPNGYRPEILEPGQHKVIPFFEHVVVYSIKPQTYTFSSQSNPTQSEPAIKSQTKDGKRVEVDAIVHYSINPAEVIKLHSAWQGRYPMEFVAPTTRQVIDLVISQYQFSEIITKKSELEQEINELLTPKFKDNYLIFDGCSILDIRSSQN